MITSIGFLLQFRRKNKKCFQKMTDKYLLLFIQFRINSVTNKPINKFEIQNFSLCFLSAG